MPRLGHKKSRTGCLKCKTRHVKCDENIPCSNCVRHGVSCSLLDKRGLNKPSPTPGRVESSSSRRTAKDPSDRIRKTTNTTASSSKTVFIVDMLNPAQAPTPVTSEAGSPNNDPYPFLARFADKSEPAHCELWAQDLELMHQWTVESHRTITVREDVRTMWRLDAPRSGIHHRFLMHQMLAFTAYHLAYLKPELRGMYYSLGIHHQDMAMKDLRIQLSNITPDNGGALFSTSALMTVSAFASTGLNLWVKPDATPPILHELLDIFFLVRGMDSVLSSAITHTIQSPFRPILLDSPVEVRPRPVWEEVRRMIPPLEAVLEGHLSEGKTRAECMRNMEVLKNHHVYASGANMDNQELRFLMVWAMRMTPDFLNMIRERDSAALALLSIYAVVLGAAEPIYWFMDGWPRRVMRAILDLIEPRWLQAIQLPLEFVMGTAPKNQPADAETVTG